MQSRPFPMSQRVQRISLGCLAIRNPIRRWCVRLYRSKWLNRVVTLVVLFNTIVLGFVDYTHAWAEGPNPNIYYNHFVEMVSSISLYFFIAEILVKIVAKGLIYGEGAYLDDKWNRMGFLIVSFGMLTWMSIRVGCIQALRVFRPLQTLPGYKVLTDSLVASLPELGNVAILLSFSCIAFTIFGMEMWQGQFHSRCRLTPYPVNLPFNTSYPPSNAYPVNSTYLNAVVANPAWYRCNKSDGTPYEIDESWNTPTNCFWPLDSHLDPTIIPRFCVATGNSGRQCTRTMWCGSNYDSDGKPRFLDISGPNMSFSIMSEPVFNYNLNFGLTNFDNLGTTLMIVLQVVTASNWMILTEMTQWVGDPAVAAIFYNALLFIGMCLLLQLNIAVLSTKFTRTKYTQQILQQDFKRVKALNMQNAPTTTKSFFPHIRLSAAKSNCMEHTQQESGEISISSAWSRRLVSFSAAVRRIVQLNEFEQFGLVVTVGNMFVMALNHAEASSIFVYNMEIVNFTFLMYFLIESILKMIGLGFSNFWTDKFNRIDLITMLLGFIEVFINPPTLIDGTPGGGGAFTSLRVLRSIKLTRSFNKLWTAMISSVEDILNFVLYLAIFCYIFALLGMELFATKYQFDPNNHALPFNTTNPSVHLHRSNYDSLLWAAFTIFQIITLDNYPSVVYDGWIAVGWYSPVYHALIIVLGAWIVMNMSSAIVIRTWMKDDESADPQRNLDMDEHPPGHLIRTVCRIRRAMKYLVVMLDANVDDDPVEQEKHEHAKLFLNKGNSLLLFSPDSFIRKSCLWLLQRREWTWFISLSVFVSCIFTAIDTPLLDPDTSLGQSIDVFNLVFAIIFSMEFVITVIAKGFLVGPDSYVRDAWRLLDGIIVMISILPYFIGHSSTGTLTALRTLRGIRALRPLRVINKLPQLKIVANTVFQSIPVILNAVVLLIFWLFIFGLMGINFFKGALNTCSISPYTYTSGQGTPPLPPWFPADYSGDYRTNLSNVDIMTYPRTWNKMTSKQQTALLRVWNTSGCGPFADEYQPTSKEICLCFSASNGTSWRNQVPQKFDNIFWAIGGLYELTSVEGWSITAMAGIDAVGEDMQPIVNNNPWMMVWWWIFMIVCSYFITSFFIAILTKSFYQDIYGALVTKEQITWIKLQKRVLALSPHIIYPIPKNKFRAKCYHFVQLQYTEYFITLCICVNVLAMCMHQYGDPISLQTILTTMNKIFIGIFVVEAILKLCAFGWAYFEDTWNQIDLAIVLVTLMSIILLKSVKFGRVITVARVFQVGRVFCFKKTTTMKNLIDTLVLSLPAFGNVTSFLMLLLYIYSAVAVQFFAKVAFDNQTINEYQNFQNFFRALQALMGFSTGENWANFTWEVYYSQPSTNPHCIDRSFNGSMCGFNDTDPSTCIPLDGCGSWFIVPFMYSFYFIFGYVGLNLFSGIVISAFADVCVYSTFNTKVLGEFADRWAFFDPHGVGLITAQELVEILYRSYPPFGFRYVRGFTRRRVGIAIGQLDIPIYDQQFVHFKDVPRALLTRELAEGDKTRFEEINKLMEQMGITKQFEKLWHQRRGRKQKEQLLKRQVGSIKEYSASVVIQRFFTTSKIQLAYKRSTKKSLCGSNSTSLPPLNPLESDNMTAQDNLDEKNLQSVDPMPFPILNI